MIHLGDKNYYELLTDLKDKIRQGRLKASVAVNQELLIIFWEIGKRILQQQNEEGWGTKIIDRLSLDLKLEFPDFKGLSTRNLKYMRAFAEAYPDFINPQFLKDQSVDNQMVKLCNQWLHNLVLP